MKLRTFTSALALTAALFATSALTLPAAAQDASTISGGFDVGPGGLQGNFNPLAATSGFTWLSTYFEPLVIYNAELTEVVGALAESFEISDDQLTYTFKLADAKWHDGEPFTAEDVKFTIDLARNDQTGSVFAARLGAIASVDAPDERTVVITLSAPTASMTRHADQADDAARARAQHDPGRGARQERLVVDHADRHRPLQVRPVRHRPVCRARRQPRLPRRRA